VSAMVTLALPFPQIDPVLIHIGPLAIRWYALAYIFGIVIGWRYLRRLVQRPGWRITADELDDLLLYVTLGIVLGGRIGYVLFYRPGFYLTNPLEALAVWEGGMSFHGGLVGVALALALFAWRRDRPLLELGDAICCAGPIGLFLGRLANFINGELWGRPAPDLPFAFVFPHAGPVPRHPSQLYEAFAEGILLLIVLAVAVRRFGFRRPGLIGGIFVLGYALARIVCEFFREPDPHLGFLFGGAFAALGGGITMGMLLSVPMAIVGLIAIWLAATGATRPRAVAPAASA
jgi:phosphatidylglycerol:prolipoprotein diacylglycerol transferase